MLSCDVPILPPKRRLGESVNTGVRLPKVLLSSLERIGESEDYSRNEVIQRFLLWALEEHSRDKVREDAVAEMRHIVRSRMGPGVSDFIVDENSKTLIALAESEIRMAKLKGRIAMLSPEDTRDLLGMAQDVYGSYASKLDADHAD